MNLSTLITRVKSTAAASPFVWRWGLNFSRTAHHMLDEPLTASEVETLNVLRSEGIIVCAAQELFGATGIQLLDRVGKEVDGLVEKQRDSFSFFLGHIRVSVARSKFQQRLAGSTTLRWTMRFHHHDGNHVWE